MFIDSHVHFGVNPLFSMPEDMVLEFLDKNNVSLAIISNNRGAELDHQQKLIPKEYQTSQIDVLKESIAFAKRCPEKIKIAIWIKPFQETCDYPFAKLIEENLDVVKAIKLHPFHSKIAPDDPVLEPYYTLAEKYHLPILSHTGGCEEASSTHLLNAALKHPKLDFIMAHMDLGTDHKLAFSNLGKAQNLYADTTWVPLETTLAVIKNYGSQKILFGSDAPFYGIDTYSKNKNGGPSLYIDYFKELKKLISKEDYDNIMYKNALRIFRLEE